MGAAVTHELDDQSYALRLYISGRVDTSGRAASNLRRICDELFNESSLTLDIVDVREHPELAEQDKVLATPTLIRKTPPPQRRLVGDFSNTDQVLAVLGFGARPLQGSSGVTS